MTLLSQYPANQIPASVTVVNDTAISLQWRTPVSIEQQGLSIYQATVQSECFTNVEERPRQSFTIPANGSLRIVTSNLGRCYSVYHHYTSYKISP